MTVPLDTWQERMERHFEALCENRADSGLPLFALEHGLSDEELNKISMLLRQRLLRGERLAPHWLLWTIYAAERGYTYEGGEYWQSFEDVTPGWDSRYRYQVSNWFARFRRTYNGVKPSGPWAEHFSIIAWPITHAVLPRYLQWQFARTLYDLRFQIARLNTIDAGAIGRLIAANAYHTSTRFEQFLQQEDLVGRIVLALLHQDHIEGEEPLLPETLDRIVVDLEKVRNARGWIKEASRVVSNRFKGLGRKLNSPARSPEITGTETTVSNERPDVRPDLKLHYKGQDTWNLQIDIPSFKEIAGLNREVRQFLRQTRCKLNGGDGKKPGGWLLSGRRQAVLRKWPDPKRPLVNFEKSNGTVSHLLSSECSMSEGPVWLFRKGGDGIAREISGRIVRPGREYIVASKKPLEGPLAGTKPCEINCEGINALHVSVPEALPQEFSLQLKEWGLQVARTIRVWPAGLPGRNWDGEGRGEWLTTEQPCFGIVADHAVEALEVSLDGKTTKRIGARTPGEPIFIQLPELAAGRHTLNVRAQTPSTSGIDLASHEGFLELRIRNPEPWIPGVASHAGFVAIPDPFDASLDVLWQNKFALSVYGPPGRQVTPRIVLKDAKEAEVFSGNVCDWLDLPVSPDVWNKRFEDFLRREQCEWLYLEASSGTLTIDGGDLGRYDLRFDHEVRPVRWVLRNQNDGQFIRLVDDTDQEDITPECHFFGMERPRFVKRLDAEAMQKGLLVEPPGGLFYAKVGRFHDAVIVSPGLTGAGLDGLGVHPKHGHISGDPRAIVKLLRVLRHWKKARAAGFLASARQQQVTNELMHGVIGIVAGWDWARVEAEFVHSANPDAALARLQSKIVHKSGFSSVILRDACGIGKSKKALISWFTDLAKRYRISSDVELCRFAIEFASRPQVLTTLYLEELPQRIRGAVANQTLIRGARLAVLSRTHAAGGAVNLIPEVLP